MGAQGVVSGAFQACVNGVASFANARTMGEAVVQCCEGAALHYAVLLGQSSADVEATTVAGPVGVRLAQIATGCTGYEHLAVAAHLLNAEAGAAKY